MNNTVYKYDALISQGGGMRAVFSAGALARLAELNVRVDQAYGTSAGSVNAAYFLTGQVKELKKMYFELMSRPGVVNLFRFWMPVDLGKLLELSKLEIPLNVSKGLPLTVTALEADTLTVRYARLHKEPLERVYDWLLAGAAIPIVYGKQKNIDGKNFVDGGLRDPLPLKRALADGNRRLVIIMTRPLDHRSPEKALWRRIGLRILAWRSGQAAKLLGRESQLFNEVAIQLSSLTNLGHLIVVPGAHLELGRLQRDPATVQRVWQAGEAAAEAAFRGLTPH